MITRVSTFQSAQRSMSSVQATSVQVDAAQRRVATGKQLNQPSDDPAGTSQTLNFRKKIADLTQYSKTMDQAKGFMSTSESALDSVTLLVRQARSLALQAATNTISTEQRTAIANQIQNIVTQVGNLGNSSYGSRYVFGGQRTQNAPFVNTNGTYTYQGGTLLNGDANLTLDVGQGEEMITNVTGDRMITPVLTALQDLQSHVSAGQAQQISHDDLANLDTQLDNLLNVRAEMGSKIQRIDQTKNRNDGLALSFTQFVSKIEDADLPKSITELQTAQLGYQAALQSTASSFKNSLLDYVR